MHIAHEAGNESVRMRGRGRAETRSKHVIHLSGKSMQPATYTPTELYYNNNSKCIKGVNPKLQTQEHRKTLSFLRFPYQNH